MAEREEWDQRRVVLTAFGEMEFPSESNANTIVSRSDEFSCSVVLSTTGCLVVKARNEPDADTEIQLTREQHVALLAAFASRASNGISETT